MSNRLGILITALYILAYLGFYFLRNFVQKKDEVRFRLLIIVCEWINVFLPAAFLFTLNGQWVFSETYLPSQIAEDLLFSTFHLLMIIITIVLVVIHLKKALKDQSSTKTYFFKRMNQVDYEVFKFAVMLLGIELYKQLIFLNLQNGLSNYEWYGLPLQLCSLPLYFFLIVPFLKNQSLKDTLYYYSAVYFLIAGLSVVITGRAVFTLDISVSIHTMIWHGAMVVVGLYLGVAKQFGKNYKQYFHATIVFLSTIVFIQIVNIVFHYLSVNTPELSSFDGFFISGWGTNENLPLISDLRAKLRELEVSPYVIGLILSVSYAVVFCLIGFLVFLLYRRAYKSLSLKKQTNEQPQLTTSDN